MNKNQRQRERQKIIVASIPKYEWESEKKAKSLNALDQARITAIFTPDPELFEMPFNLIQDTEQDGARVQAQKDREAEAREKNAKAQRIFFVKSGVLEQAGGTEK